MHEIFIRKYELIFHLESFPKFIYDAEASSQAVKLL